MRKLRKSAIDIRALYGLAACVFLNIEIQASELLPPGQYELITETTMPNLEENLRYATTRDILCLAHQPLSSAFPMLRHEALKGCRLDAISADDGSDDSDDSLAAHRLICDGSQETTGGARWTFSAHQIVGTLTVKLGGKNMTFSQRVTAKHMGSCAD